MKAPTFVPYSEQLERAVERFEQACLADDNTAIERFLPEHANPERESILVELIRIDMEFAWKRKWRRFVEDYRERFPELFSNKQLLQPLLFEEYRLRFNAGESVTASEYARAYGIDVGQWPKETGDSLPTGEAKSFYSSDDLADTIKRDIQDPVLEAAHFCFDASASDDQIHASLKELSQRKPQHSGASFFSELHRKDPLAAKRVSQAILQMPRAGQKFMGFKLVAEIGHGAFSRVFAARQKELGERLVILKVSTDVQEESRLLSRLQHTNIVPVYSVHTSSTMQAVCMPYYGTTTLGDLVDEVCARATIPNSCQALLETVMSRKTTLLEEGSPKPENTEIQRDRNEPKIGTIPWDDAPPGLTPLLQDVSYVEAIAWMAGRLADALAHAHERGIMHRDIKPANILIRLDGQPMLLDFNLSRDLTKSLGAAKIGGTLPYMAPEQLMAMLDHREINDPRCDIFSLGVVLYLLLARVQPYALYSGGIGEFLPRMLEDRKRIPTELRLRNPLVSPGLESIVLKCLEPDPIQRYQHARELEVDLRNLHENLPLQFAKERSIRERVRKWIKRHPRLVSGTSVGATFGIAVVLLASLLFVRDRQINKLNATNALQDVIRNIKQAQFWYATTDFSEHTSTLGDSFADRAFQSLGISEEGTPAESRHFSFLSESQQQELREQVGSLFLSKSLSKQRSDAAVSVSAPPQQSSSQDSALTRAKIWLPNESHSHALMAQLQQRTYSGARPSGESSTTGDHPLSLMLAAMQEMQRRDFQSAIPMLERLVRENPDQSLGWARLGICHYYTDNFDKALSSLQTALALEPKSTPFLLLRAAVEVQLRKYEDAISDLNKVLEENSLAEAYFNRGIANAGARHFKEAVEDYSKAIELGVRETRVYFERSRVYAALGDRERAQADFRVGLEKKPSDETSWSSRGFNKLMTGDAQGALDDFQFALRVNSAYIPAMQNASYILSERLQRPKEAIAMLSRIIEKSPGSAAAYSGRAILHARAGDRQKALADVQQAERMTTDTLIHYQIACVYAQTSRVEKSDELLANAWLAKSFSANPQLIAEAKKDPDLDPIRKNPGFEALLKRPIDNRKQTP